ncbi:hypothetical protein IC580_22210, partial [Cupriavidus sp. ISTL7]|uniref:Uncharacterized protein n=1 Tax=Cupriavidus gilardii TaxID=82541 RepID=A0ABY4VR80_9BURK
MNQQGKSGAKFTPGPWAGNDGYAFVRTACPDQYAVAAVYGQFGTAATDETAIANSRLIAAAPELFEAAAAAMQCIGELSPTQARVEVAQMLQSAIAKALGSQQ